MGEMWENVLRLALRRWQQCKHRATRYGSRFRLFYPCSDAWSAGPYLFLSNVSYIA